MGKYKGNDLTTNDVQIEVCNNLLHISNELADSNRLKIIELKIKCGGSATEFLKDLEDKA